MNSNPEETEIHHGLKLLAKSSFIVFIGLLLSKIFLYLYRIIIARHYGAEVYGLFALSIMILGWFRIFSGVGLKQGLLRYISLFRGENKEQNIPPLIRISFIILIITSIIAGVLLFFYSEFIALRIFKDSNLTRFLKIFSMVIPLAVLGEALLSVLRAHEKIKSFSFISNIFGNALKLAALGILIFLGVNSSSVPISYLIGAFSIFIAAYLASKFSILNIFTQKEKTNKKQIQETFKKMFSYSWPFVFYGVVTFIFHSTDSFMIGIFETANEVGFYNAAIPIAEMLLFPFTLFIQLFFPFVTREFSKGNKELVNQLSKQVGKWIFMITIPFLILFLVFPGAFINLLFGSEYIVSKTALQFLSIGIMFSVIFGISRELLSIKGKSKLILLDMIVSGIINIILNLIFVPLYGISGAGFATMLSMIFLNILFLIQSNKHLSIIPVRKKMLNITLITVVSLLLLLAVKSFVEVNTLSLIFCGIFFLAVYFLLILLTNCLDKNDLYILKSVFRKFGKNKTIQ